MNAIERRLAAALLITFMPLAAAQTAAQKPPPDPPAAGQAKDPEGSGDVGKEVGHTVDAIRAYSAERRAEALADSKRAAEELDRQMQRLQEQTDQRWERMSQAARTRSQATMADLRERRNALAEWSGGMRHSSTAAWAEVRGGFVKSYRELADAVRAARAEFDKDTPDEAAKDTPDEPAKPEGDGAD